jgi:glucan phosphoethanolaminetransferase (alkaline phosphatase superfamily)
VSLNLPEKLTLVDVLLGGYPDPAEYMMDYWSESMLMRIYGVFSHRSFFPDLVVSFFRVFYLWVILLIVRDRMRPDFAVGGMILIAVCYFLVLFGVNYNTEMITGFKHVAIQGRYIFPVIGVIYSLVAYYISGLKNLIWRRLSFTATTMLFFVSCPIYFLKNYATVFSEWFIR